MQFLPTSRHLISLRSNTFYTRMEKQLGTFRKRMPIANQNKSPLVLWIFQTRQHMTRTGVVVERHFLPSICNCYITITRSSQVTPHVMIMQLWVGHLELGLSVFKLVFICRFVPCWHPFSLVCVLRVYVLIRCNAYAAMTWSSGTRQKHFQQSKCNAYTIVTRISGIVCCHFLHARCSGYTAMTQSSELGSEWQPPLQMTRY